MDKEGKKNTAERKANHHNQGASKRQHVAVKSAKNEDDKDNTKSKLLNWGKKWWSKATDAEEKAETHVKKEWKSFKKDHKEDATKLEDDVSGFLKEMNGDAKDLIDSMEADDKAKYLEEQ